ncbi:g2/mitotic-specific cyclin cdc13 [Mycena rebaudengoi]|nr:g2/mitotic-specific cyclin cdc13 [Mycena rebaudengoi]
MASKIPVRRGRTAGAENENARPASFIGRSKAIFTTGASKASGSLTAGPSAAVGSSSTSVAATVDKERTEDAIASGKRKRQALRELNALRNRGVKGKDKEARMIAGIPKKPAATAVREPLRATVAPPDVATAPARAPVFVPPPDAAHHRRSSSGRSLIPVFQRQTAEDGGENRVFKRPRTSSPILEDAQAETEVAAQLGAYTDDEDEPEADPDGDLWDDLDAADFDDPMMVSEYVSEIQVYLKEVEWTTMPNPLYMDAQPKLSWEMRALLNEWLIQVHTRFRLTAETLFLCANLIDRFLSTRTISTSKLQLVGLACLFVAAKYEETIAPAAENYIVVSDSTYTVADLLQAEQHILRALEWNLSYPSPVNYLRRISKVDDYDPQARTLAKYLAEISLVEWRLVAAPPSLVAAAAMWLAKLALGEEVWTPNLAHYSTYAESALVPVANHMLDYVLQSIRHESFYKKYATKKSIKVSVYVRQWALARWRENTHVDLVAELGNVKNEIRAEKKLKALRRARMGGVLEEEEEDDDDNE